MEMDKKLMQMEKDKKLMQMEMENNNTILSYQYKMLLKDFEQKSADLMRSRGLFTSRSIFEFYLLQAGKELKSFYARKGLDVTTTCNRIDSIIENSSSLLLTEYGTYTTKIINIVLTCQTSSQVKNKNLLSNLYSKLCNSVHGHPWYGPTVLVYGKDLEPIDSCLLVTMCDKMNVLSEISDTPLTL
jgi:hypothetical protein